MSGSLPTPRFIGSIGTALSTLAALALLAGCAVRNEYLRPKPPMPTGWSTSLPGMEAPAATAGELARWWHQFGDPMLSALIERALAENRDVREAIARVKEARALQGVADARAVPQIGVAGSAARDRMSENNRFPLRGVPNATALYQGQFDASWELDLFGGVQRTREASAADAAGVAFDREAVAVSVSAEVAAAYLRLRSAQAQHSTLGDQLSVARDTIAIVAARLKAGLVGDLDLLRAREILATLEARRPLLEAAAGVEMRRLGVLVGAQAGSLLAELSAVRQPPQVVPQLPSAVPADLLARRADLRAIERALAAENARVGVADADRYPRLSLSLALGLLSLASGNFTSAASAVWNAGAGVRAPLYDGGSRDARLAAARARYEQAVIRYENAAARAVEEVDTAAVRYHGSWQQREKLVEAIRADEDARDLSLVRYKGGLADFLTVLDAQRQLFAVQNEEIASRELALLHLVSLYKAFGGGWDASRVDANAL
jgi:NodT family efflux transporter outer membrane factor (OMF) lipoprotein